MEHRTIALTSLCLVLLLVPAFAWCAAPPVLSLPHGPHAVGYRTERCEDRSRSFQAAAVLQADAPCWRSLQIHVWYPAADADGGTMIYGDYVKAKATPGAPLNAPLPSAEAAVAAWKARPLRREAQEARLDALLQLSVRAQWDATALTGPFPLIVYSPSINSEPMENALLFEYLASWGFVVAAAPSLGLNEPAVSRDAQGARAQRDDLLFVLGRLLDDPLVDAEQVGVLGFSWGGMAALLAALEHHGIDAVATLDGGMRFPTYQPVAASFACWDGRGLRAALLDVTLADEERTSSLADEAFYADAFTWSVPGLRHADLAWDAVARYRWATADPDQREISAYYEALAGRLKDFFSAYLRGSEESIGALTRAPRSVPEAVWTAASAQPAPPTPLALEALVQEQGVEACAELVRELRRRDPGLIPWEEGRMLGFAHRWGPDRADELLALMHLNLELYPASALTHFWLGQIHLSRQANDQAVDALQRALELDPALDRARGLLDRLGASAPATDGRRLEGAYLGQPLPGTEPRLFAPGTLSTGLHDDCPAVFSPDGREVFFRKWAVPHDVVGHMRMDADGHWSEPALFRPDGDHVFLHPIFIPGTDLALLSGFRPRHAGAEIPDSRGIWLARYDGNRWMNWQWSSLNFTAGASVWSVDNQGTAYLQAPAPEGPGRDFFAASWNGQGWDPPRKLAIDLDGVGRMPTIAPDGSYLVFNMRETADGRAHADLFVSYRLHDGTWSAPVNLGPEINTRYDEKFAAITPDGAYLFFVSTRAPERQFTYTDTAYDDLLTRNLGPGNGLGRGDVYWVSTEVVERLQPVD